MKICIFVLPKNKVRSFVNMDFEMNILTETLLDWYADNKRDLPWRDTADPYRIWISEIILQQTRVVQGYEYFLRFIRRFPDVETLAAASEDEVLKYWQGLGYYSRARNLHAAAKSMNGKFPASYQEVRALKGVGDYTAAAICSIAYNMPYAVVDGNVYLRGFGSFVVKKRAQKTARNISKNTTIIIPEHNIPAFKPAKTFTIAVKK